ncbi:amine oxidase [Boletus reticuloceps]|uniref:Amine oxidase n=1 Tax=Boletus reticuloceps TaxID=495285 RepID=A0A8I2YLT9_9AGAM|nr:amine oxidase [Boletus reticuloceps]
MFLSSVSLAPSIALLGLLSAVSSVCAQNADTTSSASASNHTTVLILGGGMTGIIAARTLHEQGIEDFIILDAKIDLGGRMIPEPFGVRGRQVVVEVGPSWIQGTQQGNGTANPIWELALKHNLSTVSNDIYGSVTTYDDSGYNDYTDVVNQALNNFDRATVLAGRRLKEGEVDLSLRSAYGLMGIGPKTPQEDASNYFQIDFEFAQSPSQTSWLASAWRNNFTYIPEYGGFSNVHQMSIDQRGFVYIAQAEAAEFLQPRQMIYNQTVNLIEYGKDTVAVHTTGDLTITADHVLCTFSVGVLQNSDVVFQPPLPDWKIEAINSIEMATYTKIFLQFNETFWFPTEMGLYAAKQRGKYPVWQSLDHVGFFPGSGIICVTVTGDWALYIEQLTHEQIQSEVMEVLRAMYPNITVPEPIAIHTTAWASNTLYRGSYANWGPSYVPAQSDNLKATVNNQLWFAGEATSTKHFGLLQGAYFEGQVVGYALAACIQGKGSCEFPHTTIPKNAQPYHWHRAV